jgi:tetratricopeptide (TPR) repeat protein
MERLARANPTAPHRDCRFARAAFAAGWITRAAEATERAVRDEPNCPVAHTMRGIIREDAGDNDAALAELTKAHQLDPADTAISLTLAQLEGRSGRRAAAIERTRDVLKREPDSPQAHYLMGWLQVTADPSTPAADAEAERHLRQVLKQNPEHAGARAELGALYARQGQYARARPLLEAARSANPTDPALARTLAQTYTRLGDPRGPSLTAEARRLEAQHDRRRSLRLRRLRQPSDAAVALQLARLELAAGQTREATDLVRQVLAADPNNRAALELLHQILGTPTP